MHTKQRHFVYKAITYIFIVGLLLTMVIMVVSTNKKCTELTKVNKVLAASVKSQTDTIQNLQDENEALKNNISLLEQDKQKLEEQLKTKDDKQTLGGSFKSYTDYQCLSRESAQWKLQEQAYTDENGLRKIGDSYLVALGSYYGTTLGTQYQVTLTNGNTFNVMLCDCKQDRHTDEKNMACLVNGSILEFYVDSDKLPSIVKAMGTVGTLDFFAGDVKSIVKI